MTSSDFFDLDIDLLEPGPWSNLGDWSQAGSYQEACRHLAERIGKAAHLKTGDRVLDIACGFGASLDLWVATFGADRVDAVEFRSSCVVAINQRRAASAGMAVVGDMRNYWKDHPFPRGAYDAVVSVDAAYHFGSLRPFISLAAATLHPGGRLAFTTILRKPDATVPLLLKMALRLARVNAQHILLQDELSNELAQGGFDLCNIEILDTQVLNGFEKFVAQRSPAIFSPRWWQISGTARLCRSLLQTYHYVLVSAERRAPQNPATIP